jgi:arylformamidase
VRLVPVLDPRRGDPARVSRLQTGTHAGTHVDAPCHLAGLAGGVETLPLEALVGPVQVIASRGGLVRPADVRRIAGRSPRRVLFRGAPVVLPSAARALARAGFLLVGTDGLSIDPVEDPALPAHAILLRAGVVILEALDLDAAEPGRYELTALPLLLPGCDGAPARAILRRR